MVIGRLLILLIALTCASAAAQVVGAQPDPPTVTVCDLLSQPLKYDGTFVRIQGRLTGTDEGTWFASDKCPSVFVTNKYRWPSVIWFSTPSMPNPNGQHAIDFQFDAESEARVEAKYRALKPRVPPKCVIWTYMGLFETRRDWSEPRAIGVDGNPLGFGHQGGAPGQLIAKKALNVAAVPGCTAKAGKKAKE